MTGGKIIALSWLTFFALICFWGSLWSGSLWIVGTVVAAWIGGMVLIFWRRKPR
jgi:hypothetical protein